MARKHHHAVVGVWVPLTPRAAPHLIKNVRVVIPKKLLGGDLEFAYRVGGGGGHSLNIENANVVVYGPGRGGGSQITDYVTEVCYTIDPSSDKHNHLLDAPYGDGTYREVFTKMQEARNRLVGMLLEEFIQLLQVNDEVSVRKAAAIKYVCRSFISADDAVNFDGIVDPETYLQETVLNAMRIFGEEKVRVRVTVTVVTVVRVRVRVRV